MRRLACCVAFSSIVSFGQMTFAAGPSFSDAAKQFQTNEQACQQPDKSYHPSRIKKLSADYAALYQAAALTSQRIDSNNPLAALAQDKMKQYQHVQNVIRDNTLELISSSTYTNPDWAEAHPYPRRVGCWTSTGDIFKWGVGGRFTRVYPAKDRNHYWCCLFSTIARWSMQSKRFASTTAFLSAFRVGDTPIRGNPTLLLLTDKADVVGPEEQGGGAVWIWTRRARSKLSRP
jgi:hypothetical protein